MNDKRLPSFSELLRKPITEVHGYFEYVKALYEEWHACDGKGYPTFETLHNCFPNLNSKLPPQFFTGDINSKVVMISLNSHAGDDKPGTEIDATPFCRTWENYLHFWTNFAYERYAPKGCAAHLIEGVSNFDRKLHRFLNGNAGDVAHSDLARWDIFHVELCPIPSTQFTINAAGMDCLENYLLRSLEAVAATSRLLVLVLNNPVCRMLKRLAKKKVISIDQQEKPLGKVSTRLDGRRIDYKVSLDEKRSVNIVAIPTFANQALNGVLLETYNHLAFTDKERTIIRKAIGVK